MATASSALIERLTADYGAAHGSILDLRATRQPEHINYCGLVDARDGGADLVIEHQGHALLYVVDGTTLSGPDAADRARRRLALRADATYMAVALPGKLQVFDLGLDESKHLPLVELPARDPSFIPRIASGELVYPQRGKTAHAFLFDLLEETIGRLRGELKVSPKEVMALVGRALFLRFLHDRGILTDRLIARFAPGKALCELLGDPATAAASSRWLDETFNGDLLTLPQQGSVGYFRKLASASDGQALQVLCAILGLDKPVGGAYQRRLDWGDVDFAYVPVGLLSEVYEEHVHRFEPEVAKATSVYYTPRRLAEFVTTQAFNGLRVPAHTARVLDAACGAGVFLVSAFRRLVQETWRATGERPTTRTIRRILNTQVRGFDVNESALQLSALALYLTALELDPQPQPVGRRLLFKPLLERVLHDASVWKDTSGERLGSLSSPVQIEHRHAYDCIIGNPPWSSWPKDKGPALTRLVRECASERGVAVPSGFKNPDQVPDLAFLWQATRWAKPGAPIALAMAGRLLFKNSPMGVAARDLILQGIRLTGLLNGAELRQTNVWPKVGAPFCLLFAANEVPEPDHAFTYLSPRQDTALNREGRMRMDAAAALPVRIVDLIGKPYAFKTLYKGDALDMDLLGRLFAKPGLRTLEQVIAHAGLESGEGYIRANGPASPPDWLVGMPDFTTRNEPAGGRIHLDSLPKFAHALVQRPRQPEIYRGPLVLVRAAPKRDAFNITRRQAYLTWDDIAYSESYYGISTHGHAQPQRLATYLFCVLNSNFMLYQQLMTSGMFGVERDSITPQEVLNTQLLPFEALNAAQLAFLDAVPGWIDQPAAKDWLALDAFVAGTLGLSRADNELMSDRLASGLPYTEQRKRAQERPSANQCDSYIARVQQHLAPFSTPPAALAIALLQEPDGSPWKFIELRRQSSIVATRTPLLRAASQAADRFDASQIEIQEKGALVIGILNQRRYWSASAARSLALGVLRDHVGLLDGAAP